MELSVLQPVLHCERRSQANRGVKIASYNTAVCRKRQTAPVWATHVADGWRSVDTVPGRVSNGQEVRDRRRNEEWQTCGQTSKHRPMTRQAGASSNTWRPPIITARRRPF